MFLEWWMIGILIAVTGLWAEYRNIKGQRAGYLEGVQKVISDLYDRKIIDIDDNGNIFQFDEYK